MSSKTSSNPSPLMRHLICRISYPFTVGDTPRIRTTPKLACALSILEQTLGANTRFTTLPECSQLYANRLVVFGVKWRLCLSFSCSERDYLPRSVPLPQDPGYYGAERIFPFPPQIVGDTEFRIWEKICEEAEQAKRIGEPLNLRLARFQW